MSGALPIGQQIDRAIQTLRGGGVVAFPTDTVYGLGADPANESAIEKIYRVKKRPRDLPLPLLLSDTSDLAKFAEAVPEIAWLLADRFLPGGLTLVLRAGQSVPQAVIADNGTVALRIPDHAVPVALARGLGGAIVGTSANLSGAPDAVLADEVTAGIGAEVDLVIDGGRCPGGKGSTVVDVTEGVPIIVREGAVSFEYISEAVGSAIRKT
jgi:L-threonylcarbamoyladenylate synthase